MPTYRLDIQYDGFRFSGWALQPQTRTVQGELEDALAKVLGEYTHLTVAGRTDAGVHALEQVASFVSDRRVPETLGRALNSLTGPDLAVVGVSGAPGFDARRDARSRRYRYRIETDSPPSPFECRRALNWPYRLDRDALDRCADALMGEHDFTAFTPTETEHVRFERVILEAAWSEGSDGILTFEVEADAFMRNMVRVMVGTMLEVAGGRRDQIEFERLLRGAERAEAGHTAAPHGLYLVHIAY